MGAIGHYIEHAGIATTGLSLVRENTAFIRPPRALWVPFALGRPLGMPNDAAFQMEVLSATLALLERTDGPVILEDFPKDAPDQLKARKSANDQPGRAELADAELADMEGMVCPVPLPKPRQSATAGDLMAAVEAEVAKLAPWAERFQASHGRTSVGVSKRPFKDAIQFIADIYTTGASDAVPQAEWPTMLRFTTEDLRNYYLEAAAARPGGAASPDALVEWFWAETNAARLLFALDVICDRHDHRPMGDVALIPRAQAHRRPDDLLAPQATIKPAHEARANTRDQ